MNKMKFYSKRVLLIGECAVLLAVVIFFSPKERPFIPPAAPTVFDTAVSILNDFIDAGDHQLGFADSNDAVGAYIDTTRGIQVMYLREDSFIARGLDTGSILDVHRKIYPVLSRDSVIRSTITFDSTPNGWEPVEFAEVAMLRSLVNFPRKDSRAVVRQIVEAPFLREDFLIGTAANGKRTIVMPRDIAGRIRDKLPQYERDSVAIEDSAFARTVKELVLEDQ